MDVVVLESSRWEIIQVFLIQYENLHKAIWYEVNEYAGKVFCMEGLLIVLFSLMYMALPISFSLLARVLVFAFVFVITLGGAIFLCIQRAKLFANPSLAMSGHDDL